MEEKRLEYNYGLAALKIWMSFEVVCCHFWKEGFYGFLQPFRISREFAVPVFMIVSFMLSVRVIDRIDGSMIKRRVYRILLPQVFWSIVLWLVDNILSILEKTEKLTVRDFLWQLFLGHSYNSPMWYQVSLLVLSILLLPAVMLLKNKKRTLILIMVVLVAIGLSIEYSGVLYEKIDLLPYELKYPLGRLIEMIPYASIGVLIAIIEDKIETTKLRDNRLKLMIVGTSIIMILATYIINHISTVLYPPKGFNYQGIYLILMSAPIVVFFYNVSGVFIFNKMNIVISLLSKFTMGVYCIHVTIGRIIHNFIITRFFSSIAYSFTECVLVYLVSLSVCAILYKLKFMKKMVS